MVRSIVGSSMKFPLLVAGLVLGLFAAGVTQLREMPVDALPDFAPVYVEVQTESLGLSAIEVEQLITAPMEQMLLNGVPWLQEISSESIPGLSSIVMVFEDGTDPLEARQVVQERLGQARDLPRVSTAPVMLQPLSSTSRVMMVRVDSEELSPIELSVMARWTLKPALQGIPGVANVAIWGQREQQMQVQVDPEKLAAEGVTIRQVLTTSANSLWVSPLSFVRASTPGTGGFIDTPNQRLGIQHVLPISEPDDLARVALEGREGEAVLGDDGRPVLLGDVVTVVEDHQPLIGDAVAGETQGLMLVIEKFPEANTTEVSQGVEDTLQQLAPGLTGVEFDTAVFRPASYIETAMEEIGWLALLGLVLLFLVIALLYDWRAGVVAVVALPLSLVAATLVLHLRETSMNGLLLAGLAVAAAAVIDDAIVDFDNARTRLAEREAGSDQAATLVLAVQEMRRPMVFATLVAIAAAVPVFWVGLRDGLDADLFGPAVVSYTLAVLASLVVALTVTPVLSFFLLRGRPVGRGASPVAGRLETTYGNVLVRGIARPAVAVTAFGVIAVAGIAVAPILERDMRPHLQERTLLVHWEAAPGTSYTEMSRITSRVADELRTVAGIENVGAHVGRALTSDEISSVNSGELWLTIAAGVDHDQTVTAVEEIVSGYPGMAHDVLSYTDERTAEHGVGTTAPEQVVVRVFGQEYDVLRERAADVQAALQGVDGIGVVTVGQQPEEAQIEIKVDLAAAQEFGLTPGEVRRAAATLVSGIEVGSLFEQQKIFQVVVLGTPENRHDLSAVNDLMIDAPTGEAVRLGDVADVAITSSPTAVRHHAVSRYVDVTAAVAGRSVADVVTDAEAALAGVSFPQEYHAEILGAYAAERDRLLEVLGFAVAALIAMFLLFQANLRSWKLAALAFIGLPLALSGGMLAAAASGIGLGLGSLLGVIVLVGMYTRNLMALFGRYLVLSRPDGQRPGVGVVVRGARERFVPIFMSAAALVALLVPWLVLGTGPGLEVIEPMAVVVLGGLVTTTAMSLFFLPLMYLRIAPHADTTDLDAPIDRHPAQPGVAVG